MPPRGSPIWMLSAAHAIPKEGEWDVICDCRTPLEYVEDHIPGAISTPVLSNEQRVVIGTMYASSPFEAQRLGAALVAGNISQIIPTHFMQLPPKSRILVYCWRGGERSGSLAHVLSRVGWHVALLEGGYRSYRRSVLQELEGLESRRYHVIGGLTGSGKGVLLDALKARGANVVDLEALAKHYGSAFGDHPTDPQPTQRAFETCLARAILECQAPGPIFVEAESPKVGRVALPAALVRAMRQAPVTRIVVPLAERVKRIRTQYRHFEGECIERTRRNIAGLRATLGGETVDRWLRYIDEGDFDSFVEEILVEYYDDRYTQSSQIFGGPTQTFELDGTLSSYDATAAAVLSLVEETNGGG